MSKPYAVNGVSGSGVGKHGTPIKDFPAPQGQANGLRGQSPPKASIKGKPWEGAGAASYEKPNKLLTPRVPAGTRHKDDY